MCDDLTFGSANVSYQLFATSFVLLCLLSNPLHVSTFLSTLELGWELRYHNETILISSQCWLQVQIQTTSQMFRSISYWPAEPIFAKSGRALFKTSLIRKSGLTWALAKASIIYQCLGMSWFVNPRWTLSISDSSRSSPGFALLGKATANLAQRGAVDIGRRQLKCSENL